MSTVPRRVALTSAQRVPPALRWRWWMAIFLACTFVGAALHAQEVAPETLLQSNVLFAQGKRQLAEGDTRAACASFEESNRLASRGGTVLNLGLCRELEGRYADARRALRKALEVARREGREDRIPLTLAHIEAVERKLSWLALALPYDIDPSVVALRLDGVAIPREEWSALAVDAGEHTLSADALGFQPWSLPLVIDGVPRQVTIPVGPLVPHGIRGDGARLATTRSERGSAPTEVERGLSRRAWRIIRFASLAVGAAGFVAGIATGAAAIAHKREVQRHCGETVVTLPGREARYDSCDAYGYSAVLKGQRLVRASAATWVVGVVGVTGFALLPGSFAWGGRSAALVGGLHGTF